MARNPRALTWADVQLLAKNLAAAVAGDGLPEVIVAIARGGLIPAVMIAHTLGIRDVAAITITHTTGDEVNAAKTAQPVIARPDGLGDPAGLDVLLVDDIAGSGDTLTTATALLATHGAARIRAATLCLNTANWQTHNDEPTYVGEREEGWVIFPWET